jgi:hypothetical protein
MVIMKIIFTKLKNTFGFPVSGAISETLLIAMLLWAILPLNPYVFYTLLKIVSTGMGLYLANRAFELNRYGWLIFFLAMVALYNPFFRPSIPREMWVILNILFVLAIARFTSLRLRRAA